MGRDTWRHRQVERERARAQRIPPGWRAMGCVLFLLFAAGGYFFAEWFLAANAEAHWLPIPPGLVVLPYAPWVPVGLPLKLLVAGVFLVVGLGILNVVYAVLFPYQPGEYDSPPVPRPPKKRKR